MKAFSYIVFRKFWVVLLFVLVMLDCFGCFSVAFDFLGNIGGF